MRFSLLAEVLDYRRMWSGTVNHMVMALEADGHEVDSIDIPALSTLASITQAMSKAQRRGLDRDIALDRTAILARIKARLIRQHLCDRDGSDALLVPVGSTLLPFLKVDLPVVYVSDATLPLITDYYNRYAHFSPKTRRRAVALERAALKAVDLGVFPTWWAAASARDDLGLPEERILVAPFGPNISDPPARADVFGPRRPGPTRLLFCAVEWERKGGPVVLNMMERLRNAGRDVELTIVGVAPPGDGVSAGVTVVPYLDKRDPDEARRFREIFAQADLFVMPTQAECFGMVFCEAAAYATPSLATRTGGVPEVVRDGETGILLPPGADGAAYAAEVAALIDDSDRLQRLRRAVRKDYDDRLNWAAWARDVVARTTPLVEARRARTVPDTLSISSARSIELPS